MGRILGKIEFSNEKPPKYFIHCSTSDVSFRALYSEPEKAWRVYDESGIDALYKAVPSISCQVSVIKKSLSYGRSISDPEDTLGEVLFGLATDDRLLSPVEHFARDGYSVLRRDNKLHIARHVDGGFYGEYNSPICNDRAEWIEGDETVWLGDLYGKGIGLCPHCVAKALKDLK